MPVIPFKRPNETGRPSLYVAGSESALPATYRAGQDCLVIDLEMDPRHYYALTLAEVRQIVTADYGKPVKIGRAG